MELCAREGQGSPVALKFYLQGGPIEGPHGLSLGGPLGGGGRGRRGTDGGYRRVGEGVW